MQESANGFFKVSDYSTINQTYYQVGGILPLGASSYVIRSADEELLQKLRAGQFCTVLSSQQMGKSSLLVKTMDTLLAEGFCCALIDTAVIASQSENSVDWYKGFINCLLKELEFDFDFNQWWLEKPTVSPAQSLGIFLEEVILKELIGNLIIFIDNLESITQLKFSLTDFFSILETYTNPNQNQEGKTITFVIAGACHPYDFNLDKNSTLFKPDCQINLKGFSLEEAGESLPPGLEKKAANPTEVIREVLAWTSGQPLLTQKVCSLIESSSPFIPDGSEYYYVEALIRWKIIDSWESHDKPSHLTNIRSRLFKRGKKTFNILALYKEILQRGSLKANETKEEIELRLAGLVVKEEGKLKIFNQIYQEVFNQTWLDKLLEATLENTQEIPTETTAYQKQDLTLKTVTRMTEGLEPPKKVESKKVLLKLFLLVLGITISLFIIPLGRSIYLLKKADGLVSQEKYREAILVYEDILNMYPESAKVWMLKGFPLSKMGRFEEMKIACDKAITIDRNFPEAWNCRGLAYNNLKEYQQAINDYDEALKIAPDFYQAWNNKAESLIRLNRLEEAMIAIDKAILAKADYLFAWNNKGNILLKMKRYQEAVAAYDNAISIDQTYPYSWNGRGNAHKALKRNGTALSDYEKAILYKPDFVEALYNKALVLIELKQYQDAITTLEKTIEINPRHQQAIKTLEEINHGKQD